jgi:hypothetical protein
MSELTNPAQGAFPIRDAGALGGAVDLRSDTVDLVRPTRSIRIGTAGTLEVTLVNGDHLIYPAECLAVGFAHPIRAKRIWAANTTANKIIGEY